MAQYKVTLNKEEIELLNHLSHKGKINARTVLNARALLLMDRGKFANPQFNDLTLSQVASIVGLSERTLNHLKKKFVTHGLQYALERKKQEQPSRKPIFDEAFEEKLMKLASSNPPKGYARWTVRLLTEKLLELKIVKSISSMTVQRALKKMNVNLTEQKTRRVGLRPSV